MQRPNDSTRVSTGAIAGALPIRVRLRLATPIRAGMTLLEMVIAMAIVVVILTAILPAFRGIRNSWDAKQAAAETLQNSRVLIDHLNYNLSKAVRITDVSNSSEISGYIQFENNDGNDLRYEIGDSNLVEFGLVGSLSVLAGPVSQLQFTCYDGNDFENHITDVNSIRFVDVNATLTNPATLGHDEFFTTSIYLRASQEESTDCGLVGWWKLDETSGTTAADSSDNGNDGTLVNMNPATDWVTGQIGGALDFSGGNDYVSLPIGSVINSLTNCTIATWVNWSWDSSWQRIWDFGTGPSVNMFLTARNGNTNTPRFAITTVGWWDEDQTTAPDTLSSGWHHLAVTIDADNHTHKLYLDGSPVAQNTSGYLNPSDLGSTTQNWLARSQYSADPYFDGILDDVRIYSRVLESDEIAQLASVLRYEDFTEAKAGSDVISLAISTPSSTAVGDLLIATVATDGDTSASIAAPVGQGWTLIDHGAWSSAVTLGAWRKNATAAGATSHTFTWTGGQQAYGWMMRFTGHNPTNPINISSASGQTSSTPTSPAVTATVDNCLILRLGAFDDDDVSTFPEPGNPGLSGHTAITMDESTSSGGGVSYEGFDEGKQTSSAWWATSVTVDVPSGTSQGDLLIAAVVTDEDTDDTWPPLSPPGGQGWTEISLEDYSDDVTLGVWWKIAGASEPASHQFSWFGGQEAYGWIMRFTGHHPTAPIDTYAVDGGYSNTPDCPSVTTTVANTMIVRIGGFDDDSIWVDNTGLSGHTDITMDQSSNGNGTCSGGAGYVQQVSAGASGVEDFSLQSSEVYRTMTVAIAPAPATGGTVSGGAGYVMQSSSGGSGTSTFSLGSSNEAQMLTIAIAPNSDTGCTGSGGIQP